MYRNAAIRAAFLLIYSAVAGRVEFGVVISSKKLLENDTIIAVAEGAPSS
jgi:hypothetical protein